MVLGVLYDTEFKSKIIEITSYIGNDKRDILDSNSDIIFLYDLCLSTEHGLIKVLLNPNSSKLVQNGLVSEGKHILVTKISKISFGNNEFFLLLNEIQITEGNIPSCSSWIALQNYRKQHNLCSNFGIDIYRWNLTDIITKPMKVIQFILPSKIPNVSTLEFLNSNWSNLTVKPNLLVRILAISKMKTIFRRFSYQIILNILVSDKSRYCTLVCFEQTAIDLYHNLKEGDLLLIGSYNTSLYQKSRLKYTLQPKKTLMNSPTLIEIKLNPRDLPHLKIVKESTLESFQVPNPNWNVLTIKRILEKDWVGSRLVDVFGCISKITSIEREVIFDNSNKTNGQYWIRLWIGLRDTTSMRENMMIKLYLSYSQIKQLSGIVPGDIILITHLLTRSGPYGKLKFLESTNETTFFFGEDLSNFRFQSISNQISNLKQKILIENVQEWVKCFREEFQLGGSISHQSISKNILNKYFTHRSQICLQLRTLTYKTVSRFIIQCQIIEISEKKVNHEISDFNTENVIGSNPKPKLIKIDGLPRLSLKQLCNFVCGFDSNQNLENLNFLDMESILLKLQLNDCIILAEYNGTLESLSSIPCDQNIFVEIEIFKYLPGNFRMFENIRIEMLGVHHRSELYEHEKLEVDLNDTQEIAKFFL